MRQHQLDGALEQQAGGLARGVAHDPAAERVGGRPVMPAAASAALLTHAAWTSSESR